MSYLPDSQNGRKKTRSVIQNKAGDKITSQGLHKRQREKKHPTSLLALGNILTNYKSSLWLLKFQILHKLPKVQSFCCPHPRLLCPGCAPCHCKAFRATPVPHHLAACQPSTFLHKWPSSNLISSSLHTAQQKLSLPLCSSLRICPPFFSGMLLCVLCLGIFSAVSLSCYLHALYPWATVLAVF